MAKMTTEEAFVKVLQMHRKCVWNYWISIYAGV